MSDYQGTYIRRLTGTIFREYTDKWQIYHAVIKMIQLKIGFNSILSENHSKLLKR